MYEEITPRPITIETIAEGAGASNRSDGGGSAPQQMADDAALFTPFEVVDSGKPEIADANNPLSKVRSLIASVRPKDLLALAEEILGLPQVDDKGDPRSQNQTEIIVLVVAYLDQLLREHGMGAIMLTGIPYLYGGTHWHQTDDKTFEALLGEFAERLGYSIAASRYFAFREKLLKQANSALAAEHSEILPGRILINFQNGTLEITDAGQLLRDFNKDDLLTYQLPFNFDESAGCPLFDQYLARVLPDPASQHVLAEFLGWVFLRELKLEKVLVLYGDGHNGKSVFFDTVNALFGENNISNIGLSSLSKMENRFRLAGALLNFGSEISDRCDADLFKKLASGEPVEARKLYKDVYIIRNYARLAFNANILPKNTEQTTGFFRRFLIVPFTETITEEEKNPDLAQKIISDELSGVFNWVIRGMTRLRLARKFSTCHAAENALAAYRKESDSVAIFLEDQGLVASVDGRLGKTDTYNEYRSYCQASGFSPLSKVNFGKRLQTQHRVTDSKSGGFRFWHLIRTDDDE